MGALVCSTDIVEALGVGVDLVVIVGLTGRASAAGGQAVVFAFCICIRCCPMSCSCRAICGFELCDNTCRADRTHFSRLAMIAKSSTD